MFLRNAGINLQVRTVFKQRRSTSTFWPPWHPKTSVPWCAHVCLGTELTPCQLVPGAGHDTRAMSWVCRSPTHRLLSDTLAAVEAVLRRIIKRKNDGALEEQPSHPCVEQIQRHQERRGGFQAAVWTYRSRILPQSVLPLWTSILR
jgi:hypothetical protein